MPLPLSFILLPTTLSSPQLTPLLSAKLNGVTIYRTLDPEPGEPFVSSSLLLLSQSLPPILALTKYECRLPLGYDTTLSGLAPFPDIWIPLTAARTIAKDLGILGPLGWLLSWKTRAMSSWFEGVGEDGGGVVAHNWRLPEDRADPSAYSHQTLLSTPITSNIVLLPAHQTILTLLSPLQLTTLLHTSRPGPHLFSLPPTPVSHLWPTLILLTTESFEAFLSSPEISLPSSTVLGSLVLPFLHLLGDQSAFPSVEREELVKLLGGRRGMGEEGRKAWVKGVEVLGGLLVGLTMGRVRWEGEADASRGTVVLPLRDEDVREKSPQTVPKVVLEVATPPPQQRQNGKARRSSSSPPQRVDSTRFPPTPPSHPPSPLPSPTTTPTPAPTPNSPSQTQIISSQLSTLIAQIDSLSIQIENQAHRLPPPIPSSISFSSSLGASPSPPSSPTDPSSRRSLWLLGVLLVVTNLSWWVGMGMRGGGGTASPLPVAMASVEENRAWILKYAREENHDMHEL